MTLTAAGHRTRVTAANLVAISNAMAASAKSTELLDLLVRRQQSGVLLDQSESGSFNEHSDRIHQNLNFIVSRLRSVEASRDVIDERLNGGAEVLADTERLGHGRVSLKVGLGSDFSGKAWLTIREAAARAHRHPETVRRAIRAGELPAIQRCKSGKWLLKSTDVDDWLAGVRR